MNIIDEMIELIDTEPGGIMKNMSTTDGRYKWYEHKDKFLKKLYALKADCGGEEIFKCDKCKHENNCCTNGIDCDDNNSGYEPKEIPEPKVLSELKPINLSGMIYPEVNNQPVFLNIDGSDLTYIGIFRTKERLKQSMKEINKYYDGIKQVKDGNEFMSSIPETITIIVDPRLTERGTVRYTQVFRGKITDKLTDIKVFDRQLNQEEILEEYNKGKGKQ